LCGLSISRQSRSPGRQSQTAPWSVSCGVGPRQAQAPRDDVEKSNDLVKARGSPTAITWRRSRFHCTASTAGLYCIGPLVQPQRSFALTVHALSLCIQGTPASFLFSCCSFAPFESNNPAYDNVACAFHYRCQ